MPNPCGGGGAAEAGTAWAVVLGDGCGGGKQGGLGKGAGTLGPEVGELRYFVYCGDTW